MKIASLLFSLSLAAFAQAPVQLNSRQAGAPVPANPRIDPQGFLLDATQAMQAREQRRLSQSDFLQAMREPGVVLLDARSADRFAQLHLQGAVNLSFPDFTEQALAVHIPSKATKILIYCNNNFENAPRAMPDKRIRASLNLSTYSALWTYGYTNVYELGPNLDVGKTVLPLAGTLSPR